jgi:hypothetical protein
MEAQSSSFEKLIHPQKWVKKTEQPEQKDNHKASSSLTFSEAYTGSCGRSCVHMRDYLYIGRIHKKDYL